MLLFHLNMFQSAVTGPRAHSRDPGYLRSCATLQREPSAGPRSTNRVLPQLPVTSFSHCSHALKQDLTLSFFVRLPFSLEQRFKPKMTVAGSSIAQRAPDHSCQIVENTACDRLTVSGRPTFFFTFLTQKLRYEISHLVSRVCYPVPALKVCFTQMTENLYDCWLFQAMQIHFLSIISAVCYSEQKRKCFCFCKLF